MLNMTASQLYSYVTSRQRRGFIVYLDESDDDLLMDYVTADDQLWSNYSATLLFALEAQDAKSNWPQQ